MSEKLLQVMYVGGADSVSALQETVDTSVWTIFHPQELLESLGMYVTYFPDVVIIEDDIRNEIAYEVYMHLRSIEAENLLILTDHPGSWEIPPETGIRTLPRYSNAQEIVDFIHRTEDDTRHLAMS